MRDEASPRNRVVRMPRRLRGGIQIDIDGDLYHLPASTVTLLKGWLDALAEVGIDPRRNVPHAAHYIGEQEATSAEPFGDNQIRVLLAIAMPWIEHRMAA